MVFYANAVAIMKSVEHLSKQPGLSNRGIPCFLRVYDLLNYRVYFFHERDVFGFIVVYNLVNSGEGMKRRNLPELEYLAQLVGEFIEYWGFKKIHGEIWLHLYLSESPLDAADLMRKLSISKALVSISIKSLLEYQVIQQEGLSSSGTKTYSANPDLQSVVTCVLRQREKVMMGKIQAAFTLLKQAPKEQMAEEKIEMNRMRDLDRFIKNGEKGLNTLMAIL